MTILVGIDGSDNAGAALRWAAAHARARGCALVAAHAVPTRGAAGPRMPAPLPSGDAARAAEAVLERALDAASSALTGVEVERRVLGGPTPARALLDAAAAAGTLVVGSRGTGGFRGLLLGSVSEQAARHATCPVVVVPGGWQRPPVHVVVGVDGSVESIGALEWAADVAARHGGSLEVVHAYRPYAAGMPFGAEFMEVASPHADARLHDAAETVLAAALDKAGEDLPVEGRVEVGAPAHTLVDASRDADLLVVGSRGRGGFAGLLLGSVGRQALQHASCPVAIVHRVGHAAA